MLFPLETSIPTAFMLLLLLIGYGFPPFPHCLFNLLGDTSAQMVALPAQIECCERERRLTDSVADVLDQGELCQAIYLSF